MCSCSSLVLFPGAKKVSVESEQSPSLWICECIQLLSPDIFIQFIDFRPLHHTIINQPNRLVRNWECESFGGISFYSASIICTMGGGTPPLLTVRFMITIIITWISTDTTWYYLVAASWATATRARAPAAWPRPSPPQAPGTAPWSSNRTGNFGHNWGRGVYLSSLSYMLHMSV